MKCLCYVLILCLSLLTPAAVLAQTEENAGGSTPAVSQDAPGVYENGRAVRVPAVTVAGLPGVTSSASSTEAGQKGVEQERQAVLMNLITRLVNSYNELNAKFADLSDKYEKMIANQSQPAAQPVQSQPAPAVSDEEARKIQEAATYAEAKALAARINPPPSPAAAQDAKAKERIQQQVMDEIAQRTSAVQEETDTAAKTDKKESQYVKLRLQENGQELEFLVDPMYVDMNFNFSRSTQTQTAVKKEEQPAPAAVQQQTAYPAAAPQYAPQQMQYPQPQIQPVYIQQPYQQPYQQQQQQPQQQTSFQIPPVMVSTVQLHFVQENAPAGQQEQDKAPAEQRKQTAYAQQTGMQPEQSAVQDTVDGIYRAQKLYYEKKYRDSLLEVQRSLRRQPTGIAYALQGSIYFSLGDLNAAVESWKAALEINPNMDDVRAALLRYGR